MSSPSPPPAPGPTPSIPTQRPPDCIRILLATDNHIGYLEKDPVRGRDSINTFKEILQLANEHDTDFVLLAGDLFHENKPSRSALYQTTALLREHCLNRRPVSVELVSDAGVGIETGFNFPPINYEDENLNVGMPVFSIHGNHDDPQGAGPEGALCALDLISASGLINYFGRLELPGNAADNDEIQDKGIQIRPLLLQKGNTKLAMYGVGNIRDERFHFEMRQNRISMFRPAETPDSWFNLLLIHQNRVAHGPQSFVPENGFGEEVDLVIWGHEHDCRIEPEPVAGKKYYISQPGSSVATSLAEGESIKKHVAILSIQDKDFSILPIPLKTVRPFAIDQVSLAEEEEVNGIKLDDKTAVNKILKQKVNELIEKANAEWEESHGEQPQMLPLIRLKVDYTKLTEDGMMSNYEVGNPQRFGQDFADCVANPRDIVQFFKKKRLTKKKKVDIDEPDIEMEVDDEDGAPRRVTEKIQVSTLVRQYLQAQNLGVLPEALMEEAIVDFVEKDDKDALKECISGALSQNRFQLKENYKKNDARDGEQDSEDEMNDEMLKAKELLNENAKKEIAERGDNPKPEKKKGKGKSKAKDSMDEDSDDFSEASAPVKGKGKGKAPAKNTKKSKKLFDSEDEDEEEEAPKPKRATKSTKATTTKAKTTRGKQTTLESSFSAPAEPSKRPARAATKKKPIQIDIDSDSDDEEEDAPRRKRGRK